MADDELVLAAKQEVSVSIPREVGFWMREKDWARIRANVSALEKQEHDWRSAGWAGVGLSSGAAFGVLGWIAPWVLLTDAQRQIFAWIWIALIAFGVLGGIVAAFGFLVARRFDALRTISVSVVLADMDNVHPALKL
jgi:hypothetical protein